MEEKHTFEAEDNCKGFGEKGDGGMYQNMDVVDVIFTQSWMAAY